MARADNKLVLLRNRFSRFQEGMTHVAVLKKALLLPPGEQGDLALYQTRGKVVQLSNLEYLPLYASMPGKEILGRLAEEADMAEKTAARFFVQEPSRELPVLYNVRLVPHLTPCPQEYELVSLDTLRASTNYTANLDAVRAALVRVLQGELESKRSAERYAAAQSNLRVQL